MLFLGCGNGDRAGQRTGEEAALEITRVSGTGERASLAARYAAGFTVTHHEGYSELTILNPYQDYTDTLRYYLVPRDGNIKPNEKSGQVIEVPINSMIATSTTHLALVDMLETQSVIKGITQPDYVYDPEIRRRVASGAIASFSGGEFNREQALALNPDLVMVSGGQASQLDNFRVLLESGINVLVNTEWLEQTPLGKAEWVKVMGLLLGKENLARKKFQRVEERYLELKALADRADQHPLVMNNLPYKGAWFVPGGNSFTARFLKDAAAEYPWYENSSTGGLRVDFETVYAVGLRADIWINPGNARTKEDLLAADPRFSDFKSFKTGRIFNNNKRMSPSGGNDFWESGVVHPEIILADLIRIMHPELLPEHQLFYYQQVE